MQRSGARTSNDEGNLMEVAPSAEPAAATPTREVPFVDLKRQHDELSEELATALDGVIAGNGFILGEEVGHFEEEFAAFCDAGECVGVSSGTAALTLGLLAAGIGPGDEVIVPAHTYIASALGVVHAGATPVLCDVRAETGLIDTNSAAEVITERTAAIMAVDLYGQVCDMHDVLEFAKRRGLLVVEDAAQAHGARFRGQRAGSFGDIAAFSFYPSKNLGALGDGGAVCTRDSAIADRVRRLRNMGQRRKGEHIELGFNERLDGIQAAFLRVKLRFLDEKNAARRASAEVYRATLPQAAVPLLEDPRGECVYHLFPVRVPNRDAVLEGLERRGVQAGIHYTPALHQQPALNGYHVPRVGLGAAQGWSEEELSLPMFPELSVEQVTRVCEALGAALEETG
jgi:dTDP-4-amino-4,6-dideoxygalactose transaminase